MKIRKIKRMIKNEQNKRYLFTNFEITKSNFFTPPTKPGSPLVLVKMDIGRMGEHCTLVLNVR